MDLVTDDVIERRRHIARLQAFLESCEGAEGPEAFPTRHHFAPGQYAREILLPAGKIVVGKIHKHSHINVLSHGTAVVATPGESAYCVSAPYTFVSAPGTKRVVLAVTDIVWTTIHVTEQTDLAKIEAEIIAPSFDVLEHDAQPQIAAGGSR